MGKVSSNTNEKIVLLGVKLPDENMWQFDDRMRELSLLTETAGGEVVEVIHQARRTLSPSTLIGKGKLESLKELVNSEKIDIVVFLNDLSPTQQKNIEDILNCKILDRNALILDIFAKHAKSRDGKLQVELAQLRYILPRLRGRGTWYSRLGGGIGTRGPGETQLETDRRAISRRISSLEREVDKLAKRRNLQRRNRKDSEIPWGVLVGYTNAGKSSILRALSGSSIFVEDQMFSTLNTTTRRVSLGQFGECLVSDTVGFIEQLPEQLIAAFSATLEEISGADILLHVIDLNAHDVEEQISVVEKTLEELALNDKPTLYIFNKIDLVSEDIAERWVKKYEPAIGISALHSKGIDSLKSILCKTLQQIHQHVKFFIPYEQQKILSQIYRHGEIKQKSYLATGIEVEAYIPAKMAAKIGKFIGGDVENGE